MGSSASVKCFWMASREAVVPARRAVTTAAAGLCAKASRPAMNIRSINDSRWPEGWAKYTGEPKTCLLYTSREFGVYDRIRDNFPKYVVTLDEFDMSRNGIKHRNIRDFLLESEWA